MAVSFSPQSPSGSNSAAIPLPICSSSISAARFVASRPPSVPRLHLHRPPLPNFRTRSALCRVASPGGPAPEPDPDDGDTSLSGLVATVSRFQDTSRIFFAVLFWMSLFFWSSLWEGWNNDKPDKGSGFRR